MLVLIRLIWNIHIDRAIKRTCVTMWACGRFYDKTWGLKLVMAYWSYLAILRPMVTYALEIWWLKTEGKCTKIKL